MEERDKWRWLFTGTKKTMEIDRGMGVFEEERFRWVCRFDEREEQNKQGIREIGFSAERKDRGCYY